MPDTALLRDKNEEIETHIAQELTGRDAIIDLEVFVAGQWRRGAITTSEKEEMIDTIDKVRLAINRGLDYTRRVRGKPGDYFA